MNPSNRYAPSGKHGSEAREHWRDIRVEDLKQAAEELGLTLVRKTAYQYRIGDVIDVYPTNGKWHDLKTQRRGEYHTINGLKSVLSRLGKDHNGQQTQGS